MVILEHDNYKVIKVDPEMVDDAIPTISSILSLSIPYTSTFHSVDELINTMRQGIRPWQLWIIVKNNVS